MLSQPYTCLFCLRNDQSFTAREHPIPESLGNDDLVLPDRCVCDACNSYFGAKLEKEVLDKAPFSVERITQAIKNKKAKYPLIRNEAVALQSTGYWDGFVIESDPPHPSLLQIAPDKMLLNPKWAKPDELARFLLKIGLELLTLSPDVDPYHRKFDSARSCARFGRMAHKWDFAMGVYPDRESLLTAIRVDEIGPLETRQIYQYGLGIMPSGNVVFYFMYGQFVFAVNLSRPPCLEYIMGFNNLNAFRVESRWKLFPSRRK